ncbi:hypothetical protein A3K86_05455 [Photobacterium jeanii]|uniref:Lon N-terminal domain-containing protein n=1 Tax=Photobacterium jeanii TaxID=858640 RepID=A0A178KMB6_9GAMM|nr:LON peptidase substrate-binding domain-containing protein [Photobacterium jeanii]OAN18340.1 hypothetical protein A3K86_05455 [Photobacterium jeanii]PST91978.1 Lon protease [Photobacterium jeanii]
MTKIALLPHTNHLMPNGRMEITLIEPRHLRMMKDALSEKRRFALCMLNEEQKHAEIKQLPAIATLVRILDFNQTEEGFISLIVEGEHCVKLTAVYHEFDGLFSADVTPLLKWPTQPTDTTTVQLADRLEAYFSSNPDKKAYYDDFPYDDICWVSLRWIEIMPIEVHYKQLLMAQDSPKLTIRFLLKLFENT